MSGVDTDGEVENEVMSDALASTEGGGVRLCWEGEEAASHMQTHRRQTDRHTVKRDTRWCNDTGNACYGSSGAKHRQKMPEHYRESPADKQRLKEQMDEACEGHSLTSPTWLVASCRGRWAQGPPPPPAPAAPLRVWSRPDPRLHPAAPSSQGKYALCVVGG